MKILRFFELKIRLESADSTVWLVSEIKRLNAAWGNLTN